MTFRVQGEILMDADQAKAELQATGTAAKTAAKDIGGVGTQGASAARGVKQLETAAKTSATGLTTASSAAEVNAAATRKMASANRLAAGSMGNLVAQGNDVFVMLAAGQNPLTLAIQQGTQITQVIGPLGAAGAFRALGGAVLGMLSPINLITIGALAATATVVNWFTSASEEGETFADGVEALETRIDSLRDKIKEASNTRLELAERFGEGFVDRAQDILDRIVEAEKRAAQREASAKIGGFLEETNLNLPQFDSGDQVRLAQEFDLGNIFFGRDRRESRALINDVLTDLAALQEAASGTLEEQDAALVSLIESYTRAAEASGEVSVAEDARLNTLDQMRLKLAEILALQNQDPAENRQTEEMLEFLDLVTKSTGEQLKANAAADEMLSTLTEQNAIAQAIAQHGADSAEVTRLRAQFALDAKLEEIEAMKVSEATKDEIRAAAQAFFDLSTADASGAIAAAADAASRLAAEVRDAANAMFDLTTQGQVDLEIARVGVEFKDNPAKRAEEIAALRAGARFDQVTAPIREGGFENAGEEAFFNSQRQAAIDRAREIARLNEQGRSTRSGSGSRGGSANEIEREQQALDRLIESKRRELDALRETDPVQREMIRLRGQLTAATPKQREEVEKLIEAHEAERVAMELKEELRSTLGDVLIEAENLKDAWDDIGDAIIRAAKEALILGQGPLAGLFGGGSGGGLLAGLFGGGSGGGLGDLFSLFSGGSLLSFANGGLPAAFLPGFAGGGDPLAATPGIVLGAGTGRSDSITARISAGEFIMNAGATARNRAALEAMNAGAVLPGFAGGGLPLPRQSFDATQAPGGGGTLGGVTRLRIEPSDMFRVVAEERARDVAVEIVDEFSTQQLPGRVEAIRRDPMGR